MLPKHTKKLILLLDPESPLWPKNRRVKVDNNDREEKKISIKLIADIMDVEDTTIENWRTGDKGIDIEEQLRPGLMGLVKCLVNNEILSVDAKVYASIIEEAIFDEEESVYCFARRLNYSITDAQKSIDRQIYKRTGFLEDAYYRSRPPWSVAAEQDLEMLQGYYNVYVDRTDHVLRCSLRVRYLLKVRTQLAIRVKMNLPSTTASAEVGAYHEYDGFVGVKPQNIYWFFEERARNIADFFTMITGRPDHAKRSGRLDGQYLTAKRNLEATILTGRVGLQRVAVSDKEREEFMHGSPRVLEDKKFNELWPSL